ncbi:MAG: bifunctional riboflavin kinase/FAD synthetase [Acidobacteriia bacterium]|nr:bifunctional riboflavin kinase/FAD synthetase [Terriglobia bacterium]
MTLAILHSPEQWTARFGAGGRTVLSVGNFDGIHLGHQKILRLVLERARATAQLSAVVTFDPHPLRVLRPEQAPRMIQTLAQRLKDFDRTGLDAALVLHFDRALSLLSPEEFIQRILIHRLHLAAILVGANFRFGHGGAGNVRLLANFGKQHGFDVEIVSPVEVEGRVVSSTAVRNAIAEGNVADAVPLLGRPFSLTGEIRPGAGRGRTILFPTLNLVPEQELLPKHGVYATESVIGASAHRSVTNVGTRPTFDGQDVTVESYLLGFKEQVTGGPMEVRFHARLRDEQKFPGPDQLRAQMTRDIAAAQDYFSRSGVPEHASASEA